ncbi:MAG: hypothetical protein ABIP53_11155 [Candidatus Limnocylindrales bacterium]
MSRSPRLLRLALAVAIATVAAACAASDPGWPPQNTNFDLTPVPVSTEVTVGENRMLFNILDRQNKSIAAANTAVELRFYNLTASRTSAAVQGAATYMSTIEGRPGLYRLPVTFTQAGEWGVEAIATDLAGVKRTGRMVFPVRETGTTPPIGGQAPASDNPTTTEPTDLPNISTDVDADPDFYRESVATALAAQEPFAVVFATPAFCTSATCGPTLDVVKSAAAPFKGRMTFIHIEPYELELVEGHLRPLLSDQNLPIPVAATTQWGLPTEPYVFVVDSAGKVTAKFEGIAAADELAAAFAEVARS